MQSALVRSTGAAFGTSRPSVASRRTLVVSNVYGDLPKIGERPQVGQWSSASEDGDLRQAGPPPAEPQREPVDGSLSAAESAGSHDSAGAASEASREARMYWWCPLGCVAGRAGGGRKWEYLRTNENGKVERKPMHVRKGDLVQVRGCGWGDVAADGRHTGESPARADGSGGMPARVAC